MRIEDIEQDVLAWHRETFPNATEQANFDKIGEELDELYDAYTSTAPNSSWIEELADVCIVAIAIFGRDIKHGVSLAEVIKMKLDINKGRVWGPESANGNRSRVK